MADIFVSYRRDDSQWPAGRINERLETVFGAGRVFFDTVAIRPGENFREVLGAKVGVCRVLLAVIGPRWLDLLEVRLGDSNDFVRIEISEGLRRNVRVIPVLIDGAKLPSEARLPDDLKLLAWHQAIPVRADTFRSDLDQLTEFLKEFLDGGPRATSPGASQRAHRPEAKIGAGRTQIVEASWATELEKRRFLTEASWNDLSGTPDNDSVQRRKLSHRFEQFMMLPGAEMLIDGLSTYVARCVPFPVRTAYHRWVISALPQGYKQRAFANLSVGSQWTAGCFVGDKGPLFRFYGRGSILRRGFGLKLERLQPAFCDAEVATEVMGGPDQMRLECRPDEVPRLLAQEAVVEALRDVALHLMERETPYKQHHCFDLADTILGRARSACESGDRGS